MREEDEIRAAVVALAEAAERGENIGEELPSAEALAAAAAGGQDGAEGVEEAALSPEELREAALVAVFDAVRAATRASRLSQPAEWEALGLVPPELTAEDLEMAVYDRLMAAGGAVPSASAPSGEEPAAAAEAPAARPRNRHVDSPFSSSNGRAVGAPAFKRRRVEEAPAPQPADPLAADEGEGEAPPASPTESDSSAAPMAEGAPETALEGAPEGVVEAPPAFPECEGIRLLTGATSYYLYDSAAMTDSYARWAFLAAEDDPVATFVECVREESAVYPRPMARATLANDPFRLDAAAVEEAFATAVAQGRGEDIERLEASNGDVYFFSTRFLTPVRAQALAEWDAVERKRNV